MPLRSVSVATGPIVDTSVGGVDPYFRAVALAIQWRSSIGTLRDQSAPSGTWPRRLGSTPQLYDDDPAERLELPEIVVSLVVCVLGLPDAAPGIAIKVVILGAVAYVAFLRPA